MLHRELLMKLVNSWRYVRRTTPFVLLLLALRAWSRTALMASA